MENLKLLSKIALSFQNLDNFDQGMEAILGDIGSFIDLSKILIFLNEDDHLVSNVFEWSNNGIKPQMQDLQKLPYTSIPSFKQMLIDDACICASDINNLPQDIINILEPKQVKAIVVYPITIEDEIMGFIGFHECRYQRQWTQEELEILSTVSRLIGSAYERKFFQEDLIIAKTNFSNFFEAIDDMFVVSSLDGKIIHCNQSLIDKLQYPLSQLKNMDISELHPVDKREEASIIAEKVLAKEMDYCPLEVESKFGHIYSVDTRTWFGKWNQEDCIFSVSKDVTKEIENLQLFYKIFENNPLPMVITSIEEGRISQINPAFIEKTGYLEEDIVGKTVDEINIFVDLDQLQLLTNKQLNNEKIADEELSIRCKDGSILTGIFSVEEITSQGTKSLLAVMVDITQRVELTQLVEDKCNKLTNIIEGTNLGTWEWNIQTGHVLFNDQWANMLGYCLEELQPISIQTWNRLAHPDDLTTAYEMINKHINGEIEYYDCEMRLKHKDGRWIWVQDRGKVTERDLDGKPLKMFGTHSDITLRKQAEATLIEREKTFFLALDKTKAGLWDYDLINHTLFLSPIWKKILGYSDDEIHNSLDSLKKLMHPDDKAMVAKAGDDHLHGRSDSYEVVHRLKHKDGDWRWILSRGGIFNDDKGVPCRWIGTIIDISLEQEQSLELERFFSISLDLLCITDLKGILLKVNQAWEDILGYSQDQLVHSNFLNLIHPDDLPKTLGIIDKLKQGENIHHFTNRFLNADGEYRYIEWRSKPYGSILYASGRDITDRITYEQKILELSNRDPLTNIYNRRYVHNRAEEIIEEYKRIGKIFSVCIIDIDNFKEINDTFGHQVGDRVLKEFASIINDNLRIYDVLGRYGGEEFIIILNNIDEKKSHTVMNRILNIIREKTFIFDGNRVAFTFSAGIVSCREVQKDKIELDELVKLADKRMYHAKNTGKNKVVFRLAQSYL